MAEQADVLFNVGERFASLEALSDKIEEYKQTQFTELWKREARTVKAVQGKIKRMLKEDLVYYEIKYCCIHGGRKFVQRGDGKRESSTFKKDCPVHVSLRISDDGEFLEVKSCEAKHNHPVSKEWVVSRAGKMVWQCCAALHCNVSTRKILQCVEGCKITHSNAPCVAHPRKYPSLQNVQFLPFPKDVLCRQKWVDALQRGDLTRADQINQHFRLCSLHFRETPPIQEYMVPTVFNVSFPTKKKKKIPKTAPNEKKKTVTKKGSTPEAIKPHPRKKAGEADSKKRKQKIQMPLTAICIPVEDEQDTFQIQLDGYPHWLLQELYLLWRQDIFCDVTITTCDGCCKAHRMVLASHSAVIAQALTFKQGSTNNVNIDVSRAGVSQDTMLHLLHFCYTGRIKVTRSTILNIIQAAKKLSMEKLLAACNTFYEGIECHVDHCDKRKSNRLTNSEDHTFISSAVSGDFEFIKVETQDNGFVVVPVSKNDTVGCGQGEIKSEPDDVDMEYQDEMSECTTGEYPEVQIKQEPEDTEFETATEMLENTTMHIPIRDRTSDDDFDDGDHDMSIKQATMSEATPNFDISTESKMFESASGECPEVHIKTEQEDVEFGTVAEMLDSPIMVKGTTTNFDAIDVNTDEQCGVSEETVSAIVATESSDVAGHFFCSICGESLGSEAQCCEHMERQHDENWSEHCEFVKTTIVDPVGWPAN